MRQFRARKRIRLSNHDYSSNRRYYVTICTYKKEYYFGEIINDKMILNEPGKMVQQTINEIPEYYNGIELDQYVVMPNHVHVVVVINNQLSSNGQPQGAVPTYSNNLSLSDVVHRIKTLITKKYIDGVKNNNWTPFNKKVWQRSFYDHIVRGDKSLQNIREYVVNNPRTWDADENKIK